MHAVYANVGAVYSHRIVREVTKKFYEKERSERNQCREASGTEITLRKKRQKP